MVLNFEQNKVKLQFTVERDIKATTYQMNVYAKSESSSAKHVYTSKEYHLYKDAANIYWIEIDLTFYNEVAKIIGSTDTDTPLPNIIDFSFKVLIDKQEDDLQGTVSVHFVRYMPQILNILGWEYGEKFQRIWFTEGNLVERETEDPKLDAISWSWIMQSSDEAREEYIQLKNETIENLGAFFDNNTRKSLKSEINKMINEGLTSIPTAENPRSEFGVYSEKIITKPSKRFPNGEEMPEFEKYYFNSKAFGGPFDLGKHYVRNGRKFDDFIAALATYNYHVMGSGYLTFKKGGRWSSDYTEVTVDTLGFYVKDSFDFIDDDPTVEQPLGFWKVVDMDTIEVKKDPDNKNEFFEVTNRNFRDYRDAHNMGYNFHLYSTIFKLSTNISFKL